MTTAPTAPTTPTTPQLTRAQRRANAAAERRQQPKPTPKPPPSPAVAVVAAPPPTVINGHINVDDADLARFEQLHQASQQERLRFADMCASALQQLAPQLMKVGEANRELRTNLQLMGEKYRISTMSEDPNAVWEMKPSEGGFVRRIVPQEPLP